MPSLSLVVITKNEERNIARCLDSVPFATEKIVIDSFSTDKTKTMAQSCGAKVIEREFTGFREQKKYGCSVASNDWILILDADEAVSPQLAKEISDAMAVEPTTDAFDIPRRTYHLGRWIRFGGWHPDYQRRLFNKQNVEWQKQELHENLIAKKVTLLSHNILHWGFESLEDQIETNNKYSTMGANELRRKEHSFFVFKLLFKPWGKFIECYIFKLGFLDGLPGFIIAVGAAYSMFLKWAKLWEHDSKRDKAL
jgi:glycosyltransferase involved in cell wall biosynthesis